MHPEVAELAAIPLFAGLSSDQLATLANSFDVEEFEAGHTPASSGAHGYSFFVVADGTARVEVDGEVVERLAPGSTFGEMVFFAPNSRRTATVLPDGPLRVFTLFGADFRMMQSEYPQVAARIRAAHDEHQARDAARHA